MQTCSECKTELPLKVLKSAAGHYLGYFCPNCGPYDRVTQYFPDKETAEDWLKKLQEGGCA